MTEEGYESRFVCKLCKKKFPCGKSLGDHMRSHVVANSAEFQEKVESNMKKNSGLIDGEQQSIMKEFKLGESGNWQSGYGLRENPKKTWRVVDSRLPLPQDKICKQCGKGFHSLKALYGHMACHSRKDKGMKDGHSWTRENQKLVFDSQSDTEAEERRLRTRSSKSKRYKSVANNCSSSASDINGQEQENVAISLMLLSRDSGNKGRVNSVVESSDNNSVVESSDNNSVVMETKSSSTEMRIGRKERRNNIDNRDVIPQVKENECRKLTDGTLDDETVNMENSDSGYFLDESAKAESDVSSVDWLRRHGGVGECKKPHISLEGRVEEYGAEGNRSLKVIRNSRTELSKSCKENEYDDGVMASKSAGTESSKGKYGSEDLESWNESARMIKNGAINAELCNTSQNKSEYECSNCKKTFKSYQALVGHRPCHKRSNASYESGDKSDENSPNDSTYYTTTEKLVESSDNRKPSAENSSPRSEKKSKANNNKEYVCPFCNRIFKNGQALGGHKRSHFISGHDGNNNRSPVVKLELPDLLDLKIPTPKANEDDG